MRGGGGAVLLLATVAWGSSAGLDFQKGCGCAEPWAQQTWLAATYWQNDLTRGLNKLPDLSSGSKLSEATEGRVDVRARSLVALLRKRPGVVVPYKKEFVAVFRGVLAPPKTGQYTMRVTSQSGARLLLNGEVVVDNDGVRADGPKIEEARVALRAGELYRLEVQYFQMSEGPMQLRVNWKLPDRNKVSRILWRYVWQCRCAADGGGGGGGDDYNDDDDDDSNATMEAVLSRVAALEDATSDLRSERDLLAEEVAREKEVVGRLKGAVGAITRQLVDMEARMQERVRAEGNSGLVLVRSRGQGTDAYQQRSFVARAPAASHNHPNFKFTVGMGEFSAVLNGVQFTTRHNDYSLVQPDTRVTAAEYTQQFPPKTEELEFPDVPESVRNKTTLEGQIAEMREYFRAFHLQDKTIRADYEKYFLANLCYLEATWTEAHEAVDEPFASDRHHIDADTWAALAEKLNFLANSGKKSVKENLPFLPTAFRGVRRNEKGDTFEPELAQWFYRILCVPVNEPVPTSRFRVSSNLHQQFSQGGAPVTKEQLGKTRAALFELNPVLREKYDPKARWPKERTGYEFLDQLMEKVPGLDGPKGELEDTSFGAATLVWNGSKALNTARYSRYYSVRDGDAMGQVRQKRGYNDLLFAAQTTHPRVSAQTVCAEVRTHSELTTGRDKTRSRECRRLRKRETCTVQWAGAEVDGAPRAECRWAEAAGRCVYRKCWSQRYSYALPLEVIYTTPLTNWNPHDIEYFADGSEGSKKVDSGGANGRTAAKAFHGTNRRTFFRTPAAFFRDRSDDDPADTSGGVTFVKNKGGRAFPVRASGHWILFPEIEGVGTVRQRYPIMPVHEHGSSVWKETKAVEELVLGRNKMGEIADIIEEAGSAAYGLQLLLGGGSHDHAVSIPASDWHELQTGVTTGTKRESHIANGHQHLLEVEYDKAAGTFGIVWCTQGYRNTRDICPLKVRNAAGGCGKTLRGAPCCYRRCPDGHDSLTLD